MESFFQLFSTGNLLSGPIRRNLVTLEFAIKRCAADPQKLACLCLIATHFVKHTLDGQPLEFFERNSRKLAICSGVRWLGFGVEVAAKQRRSQIAFINQLPCPQGPRPFTPVSQLPHVACP